MDDIIQKGDGFLKRYPSVFQYEKLEQLEQQTGYSKVYFAGLGALLALFVLFFLGGPRLLINLVGFVYPAYKSFKAVETRDNKTDDTLWLTYWVVFAFFSLTEQAADFLISWIPMYFFIKVAFLVWCYHPVTQGAKTIYGGLIKPFLLPHLGIQASAGGGDDGKTTTTTANTPPPPPSTAAAAAPTAYSGALPPPGTDGKEEEEEEEEEMEYEELKISLKGARGLPATDSFSQSCDPYIIVELTAAAGRTKKGIEGKKFKSTQKTRTCEPRWEEDIILAPLASMKSSIRVIAMSHEKVGADEMIGLLTLPLSDFQAEGGREATWYPLRDPESTSTAGEIEMEVTLSGVI